MTAHGGKGKKVSVRVPGRVQSRVWIPKRRTTTFEDAKVLPDAYVVMEGDYGGHCYLTAPMRMVVCPEQGLQRLMHDIDRIFWQEGEGQDLRYEQHRPGDRIDSGMGGGLILDDVWVHEQLIQFGLDTGIREVLSGKLSGLGLSDEELNKLGERFSKIQGLQRNLDG